MEQICKMMYRAFFQLLMVSVYIGHIYGGIDAQTVLVTGGAGYIGSHTCKALKEAGYLPVVYDSLSTGQIEAVQWGPFILGDLLDSEALNRALERYKPCAVIHFAALCNVGESVTDPESYYTNNVIGSIHLLNAMHRQGIENIIFSSSCTVYGDVETSIVEDMPKAPTNPYAKSKYHVECAIKDYAHAYPMRYLILRYFNAAGIDVDSGLKRSLHSSNFLIPRVIRSIFYPDAPLYIFGSDHPTKDGTCIRDYIHVKDLAHAHVLALKHLLSNKHSDEFNLGSGTGHSVFEVIHEVEQLTGKKVPYVLQARREGDVPRSVANVEKAKAVLGFEAQHSDLHIIIKDELENM